ncbi:TOPRIM nucleotidyl transferase/hydrolase domain-containing protein [Microbacterium sp. XT11]|uniref:TOPRIM nucleotidyl transferase/hydrolase domain-containing protein n=1 Tax=Microbacterium sp. XT11 TaxID=367477 RepID=UPI000742DD94|nr:TOPRIM nucleotidyl transferase/hydrolase domain-containing protein [Microbacterium sp. XT11]ALX65876.1 hypothetical protein AB663_000651 [Microbacterium sp. XT11]
MPETTEPRTVVLFEGASDRLAVETAARRLGLSVDELELVDLDGITNLRGRLRMLREAGRRVVGLYDAAEGGYVSSVLRDLGAISHDGSPEDAGFFGCERDLEDEVIAAAGAELVIQTLDARGELARFRVFQGQPAQRERTVEEQLHRFAGTAAGRKARFAADVIAAIPVERMPRPIVALLRAALRGR